MPSYKAPMETDTRTPLRAARPWLRALEVLAWGVFFACALAFLGVRYWLLPNIERYREDIVAAVSRSVGLKVSAGGIEAGWHGLRPQLLFADVRVFDRDGREAGRYGQGRSGPPRQAECYAGAVGGPIPFLAPLALPATG
jgi:hypothetical protein